MGLAHYGVVRWESGQGGGSANFSIQVNTSSDGGKNFGAPVVVAHGTGGAGVTLFNDALHRCGQPPRQCVKDSQAVKHGRDQNLHAIAVAEGCQCVGRCADLWLMAVDHVRDYKQRTDWMPAVRHKRSQNAAVV